MKYSYETNVDASVLAALVLQEMGLRLEAETETDVVHGYIEVSNGQTQVTFYAEDAGPGPERKTTQSRTVLTPDQEAQLGEIVESLG